MVFLDLSKNQYDMTEIDFFNDFFEGAEKRVSIKTVTNLTHIENDKWIKWIEEIGCTVVDKIFNSNFIFFLLSESSFLIGENFVMIKTCGKTKPLLILNVFEQNNIIIDSFRYSRPDLLKPHEQFEPYNTTQNEINTFDKFDNIDIKHDQNWLSCHYGKEHEQFSELITWDFDWNETICSDLLNMIKTHFPTAQINDKKFVPVGYSLNLLDLTQYVTIHVTPQKPCSYLSVEIGNTGDEKVSVVFSEIVKIINTHDYKTHINFSSITNKI